MHFYIDESGHTGTELFDAAQPRLYYGVLHSVHDLDSVAVPVIKHLRARLGVERLHAGELGVRRLSEIVPQLLAIQTRWSIRFDLCRVEKADHALICFFDQVFDAGMNPAVPWTGYWTPMRYMLLMEVAALFDEPTAKKAWQARIELDDTKAILVFLDVCQALLGRLYILPDARSRQIIGDALRWAFNHPQRIQYNCSSAKMVLDIAPNMIGFQSVMAGIARRVGSHSRAARIVVDRQSQFNKSQKSLAAFYSQIRNIPAYMGPGMPRMDLSNMPEIPIEVKGGANSLGLELTDIYLWVFKRYLDRRNLSPELLWLIQSQLDHTEFEQVSLEGIMIRWQPFFDDLPELNEEQLATAHEFLSQQEARRKAAMLED